jgi:hypothetical protein
MKTPIELLENEIIKVLSHLPLERGNIKKLIKEAKEMETIHLYNAWLDGFHTDWRSAKMPCDYYKETFKTDSHE